IAGQALTWTLSTLPYLPIREEILLAASFGRNSWARPSSTTSTPANHRTIWTPRRIPRACQRRGAGPALRLGQSVRLQELARDRRGRLLFHRDRLVHLLDRRDRQQLGDLVDRRREFRTLSGDDALLDDRRHVLEAEHVLGVRED